MRYRRADNKGGTYFFTINLADRNKTLLVDHMDIQRHVINRVKNSPVGWDKERIPTTHS